MVINSNHLNVQAMMLMVANGDHLKGQQSIRNKALICFTEFLFGDGPCYSLVLVAQIAGGTVGNM